MLFLLFLPQSNNLTDANSQDDQPSLYLGGAERIVAFPPPPPPPPFVLWRGLNSRRGRGQTDRRRRAMLISSCLLSAVRPSAVPFLPSSASSSSLPSLTSLPSFCPGALFVLVHSSFLSLSLSLSLSVCSSFLVSSDLHHIGRIGCDDFILMLILSNRVEVNQKYDVVFEIIFCLVTYLVTSCGMDRQSGLNKS